VAQPAWAQVAQVTAIQLKPTPNGLEILLETTGGASTLVQSAPFPQGFTAEIRNAQLRLPQGNAFRVNNPTERITSVTVAPLDNNRIQVVATGRAGVPTGQVFLRGTQGLVVSLTTPPATAEQIAPPSTPAALPSPSAEELKPQSEEPIELVVTATRTEETTKDVPRSVTVIKRDQIEQQANLSRDLPDLLGELVPGLQPSRQLIYAPTLRGRNALVLVDGVPISGNFTTGFGKEFRSIDPGAIERIEVVRGPSAVYGEGATGGVVNIITRRPQEKFTATSEIGTNLSLTHPEDSLGYNFQQGISGTEGKLDYTFNFGLTKTGDFFDAQGDLIPLFDAGFADSRTNNVLGKVGINFSDEQRLQVSFNRFQEGQNFSYISDPGVETEPGIQKARALEVGELDFIGAPGPGGVNTVLNLNYNHENLFGSQLGLQAYYRDITNRGAFADFRPFDPDSVLDVLRSEQKSERFGGRLQIETPLLQSAKLLWGADYSNEDVSENYDLFDPVEFDTSGSRVLRRTESLINVPPYSVESLGLFAQLQWEASDRFLLSGGLRHERFGVTAPGYTSVFSGPIQGGDRNGNGTVFNAGAVFKATPELSLFANFAQGFSLPDIARLFRRPPEGFNFGEDFELSEPVKVNNYEIGVRGEWQNLQGSLAGFYNTSDLGASVVFDDPARPGRLVRAPQRNYGVEAALDWQPGGGFSLGGSLTYSEGENDVDENGEFLALDSFDIAPLKLTAYVEHQTTPGWRNRLQLLYVGDRDRAFEDGVDPVALESYLVLDYISGIWLGPGELQIGIENLLNNQYATFYSQYLGGLGDSSNYAARGRTLSVGYRFTW